MRSRLLLMSSLRWLALALGLLVLAGFAVFGQDTIDRAIQPICPAGWWHTSPFWAHCAFPPISIAKYAGLHVGACLVSLLLFTTLAPRVEWQKWQVCSAVLLLFLLAPMAWMLFNGWSWSAGVAFGGVALLALVFACGAYAARSAPGQPQ